MTYNEVGIDEKSIRRGAIMTSNKVLLGRPKS